MGENWTCCIIIKQVFNSRKAQPFGIQPKEGKASLHFLYARRSRRSLRKTCHATAKRLGEDDTCCIIIKQAFNSRKAQPFGIHFDIGCCRPIPSNVNLKKKRAVCIYFLHARRSRRSLRDTCYAGVERQGENGTCFIIIKQVK